jgi:hypothetical protein
MGAKEQVLPVLRKPFTEIGAPLAADVTTNVAKENFTSFLAVFKVFQACICNGFEIH